MPSKNEMAATLSRAEAVKSGLQVFDGNAPQSILGSSNSRKMFGFTRKKLPSGMPVEPRLYIYSISVYGDTVDIGPGFPKFKVEPCPEDKSYGPPCMVDALYFQEEAQVDKTEFNPHTGHQIADAIMRIGPGMAAAHDRRKQGWFISSHNPPLAEEVSHAVEIYNIECQRLVKEGNAFAAAGRLNEINEVHQRAAAHLKQKVDWNKPAQKMLDCPGCGEPVRQGVIWHATPVGCGFIFDRDKYNKHFNIDHPHRNPIQPLDTQPSK